MSAERKFNPQNFDILKFFKARRIIAQNVESNVPSDKMEEVKKIIQKDYINRYIEMALTVDPRDIIYNLRKGEIGSTSVPMMTASLLTSQFNGSTEAYFEEIPTPSTLEGAMIYSTFFDFLSGAVTAASSIINAEFYLRGDLEKVLEERIHNIQPIDPISNATAFLAAQKQAVDSVNLLKQDPTGRLLLQHTVASIETKTHEKESFPFQDRNLVLQGARFAVQFYEIVYPLAEKVKKGQV